MRHRKYRNKPTGDFPSTGEAQRYADLALLEKAGEITKLKRQQKIILRGFNGAVLLIKSERYPNGRQASMVVDFTYHQNGVFTLEDFKGFPTPAYKLKRAIVEAMGHQFVESKAPKRSWRSA